MENKKEFVNIKINKEVYEFLKLWNKERKEDRKNGKNQMTRNPIYRVETACWVVCTEEYADKSILKIMNDEFTLEQIQNGELEDCIWFMDDEKIEEIKELYSLEDVVGFLKENGWDSEPIWIEHTKLEYEHKAVFLTHKEAEEYMQYQGHNLNNPRIYVSGTGYDNRGSLDKFLQIIDFEDIFEVIE